VRLLSVGMSPFWKRRVFLAGLVPTCGPLLEKVGTRLHALQDIVIIVIIMGVEARSITS
jgi:hypothetical protein